MIQSKSNSFFNYFGNKNENIETDDYVIYRYGIDNVNFVVAYLYKKFRKIWVTGYGSSYISQPGYWLCSGTPSKPFENITLAKGSSEALVFKSNDNVYFFNPTKNVNPFIIIDGLNGPSITDIVASNLSFAIYNTKAVYSIVNTATFVTQLRIGDAETGPFLTNVSEIYSNTAAFAAITSGNSVFIWGDSNYGGINQNFATQLRIGDAETGPFLTGVSEIYSNTAAFAAITSDNGVFVWGDSNYGGINQNFATQIRIGDAETGPFLTGVSEIYSNTTAFAALCDDGTVFVWGDPDYGGINPNFAIQLRIGDAETGPFLTGVSESKIYSSENAFAAVHDDGTVFVWGSLNTGGINPNFATQLRIGDAETGPFLTDVDSIVANSAGFMVKSQSPSGLGNDITNVYVWGNLGFTNIWPTTYAQLVEIPETSDTYSIEIFSLTAYSFCVKTINSLNILGTLFLITPSSLTPEEYPGYINVVNGTNNGIIYNDENLIGINSGQIDSIYKTKNADNIQSVNLNYGATAFKNLDGNVFTRGHENTGGIYYSLVAAKVRIGNQFIGPFLKGVKEVFSGASTFATITSENDGTVYVWGNEYFGGINPNFATQLRIGDAETGPFLTGVQKMYSNTGAFTAQSLTDYVYVWGDLLNGGINPNFATQLRIGDAETGPFLTGVQKMYSNTAAFTAQSLTGYVYVWGNEYFGGINQSFATQLRIGDAETGPFLTNISEIYSNQNAFACTSDTGVFAWGNQFSGGINQSFATRVRIGDAETGPFLTNISEIYSSENAFAAITSDNGVFAWGNPNFSGININFATQLRIGDAETGPFLMDVQKVYSNTAAFAAITSDNSIYVWGNNDYGGINQNFAIQLRIGDAETGPFLMDVQKVYSNTAAFAAITSDNGVFVWGDPDYGGINQNFAIQLRIGDAETGPFLTNISEIYSNTAAFAALCDDGTVFVWGAANSGGINQDFATQLRIGDAETGPFLTDIDNIYGKVGYFIAKSSYSLYYGWGDNPGFNLNYATLIPIADYEEVIAPVLENNSIVNLNTKNITVNELLNSVNSDAEGIAITRATNWRYKPSKSELLDISSKNALLLLKDAELEYIGSGSTELEFKAWNGEIGNEGDYLNTDIKYFNLVSDNKATVSVASGNGDSVIVKVLMIILLVVAVIVIVMIVIYFFNPSISISYRYI